MSDVSEDGSTVSDWDDEEQRRGISINLAVVPVEFQETKLNLVDTPGYLDFVGEVISGLSVSEAGLVLLDSVAGVEVGTELSWEQLDNVDKPRLIFVNKMDRENANFANALASATEVFLRNNSAIPAAYWFRRGFRRRRQPG